MKNILCFEGEWKFNTHKKPERFDLNSEPILRMLKEYHKITFYISLSFFGFLLPRGPLNLPRFSFTP